ncbi:unnamed protein product [Rotaria socialis]|uniref:EF-hand domain-containing protein n=1 Tax=Rotaria socialis TaxID=392032 RepID=A0A817V1X3_9BILA|nr:unnamed protein product [Rotaria socialis]CAF3296335.1 unnamed protein product [Rotaria socialis]CAF3338034.1 unnamed protein product [Rotaria socialis]CAF3357809.1 unnamed protein product [Rotaria socialis]CAF3416161.1 unnamed protein product [Rotaria socialis]
MGGITSSQKTPKISVPQYGPSYNPAVPYGTSPPMNPYNNVIRNSPPLSKKEQRKLIDAYQTIQTFQNRMPPMARPNSMSSLPSPYSTGPSPSPPPPYGNPPIMNVSQPSPLLQRAAYGQHPYPPVSGGFRDTDFAAVANIAGLHPTDVALLHREYSNLTRGGRSKIDRVVFRQLLRDVLVEANNENVDRSLENIFVSIDRNHDGFIDFPEFVGAFRDVLKGDNPDSTNISPQFGLSDLINEQLRANIAPSTLVYQPLPQLQQPTAQVISVPSTGIQQQPVVYNGSAPLVISVDSNQSSYIPNMQGQQFLTQSPSLQYLPISM